ncbi:hypothetical protein Taro_016980, partial [Colocasia esculenta]|nr:hypothetical protein [Colocasia esculenta]
YFSRCPHISIYTRSGRGSQKGAFSFAHGGSVGALLSSAMGGGKLKELAASVAGKVISSTNTAGTTAESLSSLFLSTLKKSSAVVTKEKSENHRVAEVIATGKKSVSSFFGPRSARSSVLGVAKKAPSEPPLRVSSEVLSVLKEAGQVKEQDTAVITSALQGETGSLKSPQSEEITYDSLIENSFHDTHTIFKSHIQKERSRERKARWTHKNTQDLRFSRLIKRSADTLGTESTLKVLSKLGKETGVKEYNALIGVCIDKARQSNDEDTLLVQIQKAFHLVRTMKEQGFQIEEESYGKLLMYLIETEMIEEFKYISEMIKNKDPQSNSRICYYEMLLWIRIGNEEKIRSACDSLQIDDDNFLSSEADGQMFPAGSTLATGEVAEELPPEKMSAPELHRVGTRQAALAIAQKLSGVALAIRLLHDGIGALPTGDLEELELLLVLATAAEASRVWRVETGEPKSACLESGLLPPSKAVRAVWKRSEIESTLEPCTTASSSSIWTRHCSARSLDCLQDVFSLLRCQWP